MHRNILSDHMWPRRLWNIEKMCHSAFISFVFPSNVPRMPSHPVYSPCVPACLSFLSLNAPINSCRQKKEEHTLSNWSFVVMKISFRRWIILRIIYTHLYISFSLMYAHMWECVRCASKAQTNALKKKLIKVMKKNAKTAKLHKKVCACHYWPGPCWRKKWWQEEREERKKERV